MKSKLIGIYSFHEPDEHYIPGMAENLSCVDKWIAHDDRGSNHLWYHEGDIRNKLIQQAIEAGADWIIGCDPDERYETRANDIIRGLVDEIKPVAYAFNLREMYTRTEYRVDGIWGLKRRVRLWKVHGGARYENKRLHSAWHDLNLLVRAVDINIYHLKMIDPVKREERKRIYKEVDAESIQGDYDYLTDETGIRLEPIPNGRDYG